MVPTSNHVPKYCYHRASGQGCVYLGGRTIYLGIYRSKDSRDKYNKIMADWLAAGRVLARDTQRITVAEVVAAFRRWAREYYGPDSRTPENFDGALKPVVKDFGRIPAADFRISQLKGVRQSMIDAGRVRGNINHLINKIRYVFRWAAENSLIRAEVYFELKSVAPLRRGRGGAVEGKPVQPVPVEHVEAVIPYVSPQIGAMIRLQLLTGMRAGEVVIMRGVDIDTAGMVWVYRPVRHKTMNLGHTREIFLGPKSQDVIRPFLKTDLSAYIFSPIDAEAQRRKLIHAARQRPMNEGNKPGSNRKQQYKNQYRNRYNPSTYLTAIYRGCDRAFPAPDDVPVDSEKIRAWKREHRWHTHQLRHTAATELRRQYELETAAAILGHRRVEATQIYAERNLFAARQAMAEVG
jgi:integrase